MLQVIREFGLERLAAGPDGRAVRDRHLAFFADLARQAEPYLTTTESVPWLDRLEVEQDNIRPALRWAREASQAELGLAAAGRLWRFWHQRGHLGEGRGMLVDLLSCPAASQRTIARAIALNGAASIAYWQNDFATARAEYEEARDIFREHGDAGGEADVLYSLGYLELIDGHHAAGHEAFEGARSTFSALGNRQGVSRALQGVLLTEMVQGDVDAVRRTSAEALPLLQELGERFGLASVLSVHGRAELIAGEIDRAEPLLRESIRLFFEARDDVDTSMVLEDLGAVAFGRGDAERAVRLAAASAALRERMGGGPPRPLVLPLEYVDAARDRLPLADRVRVEAEGSAMATAEAVRYALSDAEAGGEHAATRDPAGTTGPTADPGASGARESAPLVSADATTVT
jgi:non-specific serine/threonine protein kinase